MKGGKRPHGFTIVETMVVLAVTGVLLLSAMAIISGKQSESEFQVSINNLQQQLQQIINETSSGYYPNGDNFTCGNTGQPYPKLQQVGAPSGTPQGQNVDCIFIGKALAFGWASSSQRGDYTVFPLTGWRLDQASQQPVTTLVETWPVAVAPGGPGHINHSAPDDSTTNGLQNGLTFYSSKIGSGAPVSGTTEPTIIAFMSDLGTISGGVLTGGSQQLRLYSVSNTGPGSWTSASTTSDYVDLIDGSTNPPSTSTTQIASISLCFTSGTTNQSGLITIGSTGSTNAGLGVTTKIFNDTSCT